MMTDSELERARRAYLFASACTRSTEAVSVLSEEYLSTIQEVYMIVYFNFIYIWVYIYEYEKEYMNIART